MPGKYTYKAVSDAGTTVMLQTVLDIEKPLTPQGSRKVARIFRELLAEKKARYFYAVIWKHIGRVVNTDPPQEIGSCMEWKPVFIFYRDPPKVQEE